MAVKERKQITGTTAQINAYKGHEGQIVWDKEKKTLVGMSGTAGKNYPLAPKTYVDNEVAKKQPKGDYATNAQLTEGLAGKEDKGVCLPLTGGTVLGDILSDPVQRDELYLGHTYADRQGAFLALRSSNRPDQKGTFALSARLPNTETYLIGHPTGELVWNGAYLVSTPNVPAGVMRFSNGLQLCWGSTITAESGGAYVSFGSPFADNAYTVTTAIAGGSLSGSNVNNWTNTVERVDTVGMNLWVFNNGVPASNIYIYYTAIGYWTVH